MQHIPSVKSGAQIGILGGSFDPPHIGHQLLALSFMALEPVDELWVIPCANHVFKGALSAFSHRLAMCSLAFARLHNVRVLDVENHLTAPNYTLRTN
jgi:nicotinate-nucleotide adenylyltransferase